MERKEILNQVATLKDELLKLRFQAAVGQLQHPHKMKAVKKQIAKLLTQLNSQKGESK